MLDIGVIIPELTQYGGAQRLLIECVTRWQNEHRVTLYATKFNRQILREHGISEDRVRRKHLAPLREGPCSTVLNGVLLPKVWQQEIGEHDIYHAHQWPTHLIDRHPLVWYPHEPWRRLHDMRLDQRVTSMARLVAENLGRFGKDNYRRLADFTAEAELEVVRLVDPQGRPDRVVANSQATARYLERVYGWEVRDVVYPGVTVSEFVPFDSADDVLVVVGSLGNHKRVRLALETLRLVDSIQLYVAGNGSMKQELEAMAKALGVADRMWVLEGLSNRDIQTLIARSLAVLFTPLREPFGIVALEALAAGRPLIAVPDGGYAEVVDESCAFLVPPEPAAIAERVRFLRENPEIARRMGQAGRERAALYSWDRTASELIAIIEETHCDWVRQHAAVQTVCRDERVLFGVDYHCGYGDGLGKGDWQPASISDMPALGYYDSCSGTVIAEHLKSLEQAGFDFAVLHAHLTETGPDGHELMALEQVFAVAERDGSPMRFAVQVCPGRGRAEDLANLLDVVRHVFARREHYLRRRGRPVLFIRWEPHLKEDRRSRRLLMDRTEGFARVLTYSWEDRGDESFQRLAEGCDGRRLADPFAVGAPDAWEKRWQRAYESSGTVRTLTVGPGRERDADWTAYRRMLNFVLGLGSPPELVVVTSFNDYRAGTHIEKSLSNGTSYLDLSRGFIREARQRWTDGPALPRAA